MTSKDLMKQYKDLFILVIEAAGDQLDNDVYRNVEETLKDKNVTRIEQEMLSYDEFPLNLLIVVYIFSLLVDSHSVDEIVNWSEENIALTKREEFTFVYDNFVKVPTDKFTRKMGLPRVNIEDYFLGVRKRQRKE